MKQVLESSVPGWNWGENGLVNLALPPFHDGFLWSSLDSEFCRQVENHCPACHPSCTFTVLSNSTSERLLPQHKGVHNPSVFSGLWCSSAKDADVYSYLWFLEGLFYTEHSLLAKKKFSMLKLLEDLIKSSEHLLSIKDITFISRLPPPPRHKAHLSWTAGPHSWAMSLELSHITAEVATAMCAWADNHPAFPISLHVSSRGSKLPYLATQFPFCVHSCLTLWDEDLNPIKMWGSLKDKACVHLWESLGIWNLPLPMQDGRVRGWGIQMQGPLTVL